MLASENRMKKGGDETERTHIDLVALEIPDLGAIDHERSDIAGIVTLIDPDGDLRSPVDNGEPAVFGLLPVGVEFGEERLEGRVIFLLHFQVVLLAFEGLAGLPGRPRLQLLQLCGKSNDVSKTLVDDSFDLADRNIEMAVAADENMLSVGVRAVELVMGGRVDGSDMLVGDGEDPIAGVALARLHLPEQERNGALRVVGLPGDGDA